MAFITNFTCVKCEQPKFEVVYPSHVCEECRFKIEKIEKIAHLEKLKLMPLEARVHRIEELLYELNADDRLSALESKNATY